MKIITKLIRSKIDLKKIYTSCLEALTTNSYTSSLQLGNVLNRPWHCTLPDARPTVSLR